MASATITELVGYLLLPATAGEDALPPDLARACDLLAERAPTVEPDAPAGAWFALRDGKRAPAPDATATAILALLDRHGVPGARLVFAPTPGVARPARRRGARSRSRRHRPPASGRPAHPRRARRPPQGRA